MDPSWSQEDTQHSCPAPIPCLCITGDLVSVSQLAICGLGATLKSYKAASNKNVHLSAGFLLPLSSVSLQCSRHTY